LPLSWGEMEERTHTTDLPPVRIISELPIALQKAGVPLRSVLIGVAQNRNPHIFVRPFAAYINRDPETGQDEGSPTILQVPAWHELLAACQ